MSNQSIEWRGFPPDEETAKKLRSYAQTEEYKEDKRRMEQGKMPKRIFGIPVKCDDE